MVFCWVLNSILLQLVNLLTMLFTMQFRSGVELSPTRKVSIPKIVNKTETNIIKENFDLSM